MLGLGLVVGSLLLLVVGTLFGGEAYSATVKTTSRKTEELELVHHLIELLKGPDNTDPAAELREFEQSLQDAEKQLGKFREKNADTVSRGLDPDTGDTEAGLVGQLDA